MVLSGAKGSTVNTMQISCLLGQIELEGRPYAYRFIFMEEISQLNCPRNRQLAVLALATLGNATQFGLAGSIFTRGDQGASRPLDFLSIGIVAL
jgi:hypothetical protein